MFKTITTLSALSALVAAAPTPIYKPAPLHLFNNTQLSNTTFGPFAARHFIPSKGSCGFVNTTGQFVASIKTNQTDLTDVCGMTINVTNTKTGGSVLAQVVDECITCSYNYLLLSEAVFDSIQNSTAENVTVTYHFDNKTVPAALWGDAPAAPSSNDWKAPASSPKATPTSSSAEWKPTSKQAEWSPSSSYATPTSSSKKADWTPSSSPSPKWSSSSSEWSSSSSWTPEWSSSSSSWTPEWSSSSSSWTPEWSSSSSPEWTPTTSWTPEWTPSSSYEAPSPSPQQQQQQQQSKPSYGGYTGQATYYDQGGQAGSCGSVHSDSDYIVAMNTALGYNTYCGRTVTITNTNTGKSITATVADACPSCGDAGNIDLSKGAWSALDSNWDDGVFPISWYFN